MKKEIREIGNTKIKGYLCIHRYNRLFCRNNCNFCGIDDFLEGEGKFRNITFKIGDLSLPNGGKISHMGRKINVEYEMKIFIFDINLIRVK